MTYQEYLQKVKDIVKEEYPDGPEASMACFFETWMDAKHELEKNAHGLDMTTWDYFNQSINGLRPNEFSIICGPTGSGKTTLLANMACNLAAINTPIFIGAVETGKTDFIRVMAAILAGKDPYTVWSKEDISTIDASHAKILKSKQHVFCRYDSRVNHERLLADLLFAHEHHGVKVAFIDNLNFLLDVKKGGDMIVEMDRAVHDFVVFVKKVPMHIFMVMHPRKTEGGRVVSEFDIKGSSTAVQESANVILWNRLEKTDHAPMGHIPAFCREMKFCKVRKNGKSVGARIIFSVDKVSPKLSEVAIL